jgi:hypothetical protein
MGRRRREEEEEVRERDTTFRDHRCEKQRKAAGVQRQLSRDPSEPARPFAPRARVRGGRARGGRRGKSSHLFLSAASCGVCCCEGVTSGKNLEEWRESVFVRVVRGWERIMRSVAKRGGGADLGSGATRTAGRAPLAAATRAPSRGRAPSAAAAATSSSFPARPRTPTPPHFGLALSQLHFPTPPNERHQAHWSERARNARSTLALSLTPARPSFPARGPLALESGAGATAPALPFRLCFSRSGALSRPRIRARKRATEWCS